MTSHFVLDCSIAMAWCMEDETSDDTQALLNQMSIATALVPPLWHYEVANALVIAQKRGRHPYDAVTQKLQFLYSLDIETTPMIFPHDTQAFIQHANRYGLTAYDAAYLHVALEKNLPLATLDKTLAKAAKRAGVELVL